MDVPLLSIKLHTDVNLNKKYKLYFTINNIIRCNSNIISLP